MDFKFSVIDIPINEKMSQPASTDEPDGISLIPDDGEETSKELSDISRVMFVPPEKQESDQGWKNDIPQDNVAKKKLKFEKRLAQRENCEKLGKGT